MGNAAARHAWIDIAKAMAILLVVLNHQLTYFASLDWSRGAASMAFWNAVCTAFLPIRVPLFFLASGLLAARAVERDWSEVWRGRVARYAWLYVLWALVYLALVPRWPAFGLSDLAPQTHLARIVAGVSLAWYLWALPLVFLVARATRSLPTWLVLGAALLLAFAPLPHMYSGNVLRCLPFYLAGVRLPDLAWRVPKLASPGPVAMAVAAYAALFLLPPEMRRALGPVIELGGVTLLALSCAFVARHWQGSARAGRWLGERTLPIYVLHFPLLTALALVVPPLGGSQVLLALYPLVGSVLAVGLALGLHRVLRAAGLRWLFELPSIAIRPALRRA